MAPVTMPGRSDLPPLSTNPENTPRQNSLPRRVYKIAVVISHPIQYFVPLFRRLAAEPKIDCTVLYSSLMGSQTYADPGFGLVLDLGVKPRSGSQIVFQTISSCR